MGLNESHAVAAIAVSDMGRARTAGTVDELAARGVVFEQYGGGPIETNEKGIARIGDGEGAWLKDPDGNILGIVLA